MNDLVILHLSDLHIEGTGKTYSKLLKSLLDDIYLQIAAVPEKRLVVVVTGDIFNKGDVKALSNAKKFFSRLYDILKNKIIALYIVPGNHDKKRTEINKILVPAYRKLINDRTPIRHDSLDTFGDIFQNSLWPIQENTYKESGYTDLMEFIYDKFDMADIYKIAQRTYGVHVIEIAGKQYCFVLLNTAWSCIDDEDNRQIILGKFQLDSIRQDFHDLTDEEDIRMTFVLGHHPIESLHGMEQDTLFSNMISYTEMCANAYLCGHTHDRTVINWSNNRHAIHTLMTGFGWPEKPDSRVHDHYYSIYYFNLELNSMDIYVRKTNDGSEFIPDLSIYTGNKGGNSRESDKLVRPIRFREAQGEIILSSAKTVPSKTFYVSTEFLKYCKVFMERMCKVFFDERNIIENDKNDLFEMLIPDNFDSIDDKKKIGEINEKIRVLQFFMDNPEMITENETDIMESVRISLKNNKNIIFEHFLGFIQWLCQQLHEGLIVDAKNQKIIRSHFRYLADKTSNTYQTICSSFSTINEENEERNQPTDIKYGDLIEAAFLHPNSGCLIYSVNEHICTNKLKDKWNEFITVIPKFDENRYIKKVNKNTIKKYPLITFGVTIEDASDKFILQCLDYYSFDKIVADLLKNYTDVFMIDLNEFVAWLRKDEKMEESENAFRR